MNDQKQRIDLLQEVLGDVQGARLTAEKTASIEGFAYYHQYKISGFVLCNENGDRCIVEMSAVRWLKNQNMQTLMHGTESPFQKP